jgi:hypothetical protein
MLGLRLPNVEWMGGVLAMGGAVVLGRGFLRGCPRPRLGIATCVAVLLGVGVGVGLGLIETGL